MIKTTKEDFKRFVELSEHWQQKLGLIDWDIYYNHEKKEGVYASTRWNLEGMVATITLAGEWDELRVKSDDELNKIALHEILHVAMAAFIDTAESRWTTQELLDQHEHALIRRLIAVITAT